MHDKVCLFSFTHSDTLLRPPTVFLCVFFAHFFCVNPSVTLLGHFTQIVFFVEICHDLCANWKSGVAKLMTSDLLISGQFCVHALTLTFPWWLLCVLIFVNVFSFWEVSDKVQRLPLGVICAITFQTTRHQVMSLTQFHWILISWWTYDLYMTPHRWIAIFYSYFLMNLWFIYDISQWRAFLERPRVPFIYLNLQLYIFSGTSKTQWHLQVCKYVFGWM